MSMERPEPEHDLGMVNWIGAESVGVPGQRTFRLMMMSDRGSAQLWLEKEQLQQLAEHIARMLLEIDADRGGDFQPSLSGEAEPKPDGFPARPDIEFQIVALGLRYDVELDLIALDAFERDESEDSPPNVRCLTTRRQME